MPDDVKLVESKEFEGWSVYELEPERPAEALGRGEGVNALVQQPGAADDWVELSYQDVLQAAQPADGEQRTVQVDLPLTAAQVKRNNDVLKQDLAGFLSKACRDAVQSIEQVREISAQEASELSDRMGQEMTSLMESEVREAIKNLSGGCLTDKACAAIKAKLAAIPRFHVNLENGLSQAPQLVETVFQDERPAMKQHLTKAMRAILSREPAKTALSRLETPQQVMEAMRAACEKEVLVFNNFDALMGPMGKDYVMGDLAQKAGMTEAEVEALCGKAVDETLGEFIEQFVDTAERLPGTDDVNLEEYARFRAQLGKLVDELVASRQAGLAAIDKELNGFDDLKQPLRRAVLAGTGFDRPAGAGGPAQFDEQAMSEFLTKMKRASRVSDAVAAFCRSEMTVEALRAAVTQHFPQTLEAVEPLLAGLSQPITIAQFMAVIERANVEFCAAPIRARLDSVSPAVAQALHFEELMTEGRELTQEELAQLDRQAAALKPFEERLLQAENDLKALKENEQVPPAAWQEIGAMRHAIVATGRVTDADIEAFAAKAQEICDCSLNVEKAIEREVRRHPEWTDENRALFKTGLGYLRRLAPSAQPFFPMDPGVKSLLALIDGSHPHFLLSEVTEPEQLQTFVKACTVLGDACRPYIMRKLPELTRAFQQGQPDAGELMDVIFGKDSRLPSAGDGLSDIRHAARARAERYRELVLIKNSAFYRSFWAPVEQWVRNDEAERLQKARDAGEAAVPKTETELLERIRKGVNSQMKRELGEQLGVNQATREMQLYDDAVGAGILPELAAQQYGFTDKSYDLKSFVFPLSQAPGACSTVEEAEHLWVKDFLRSEGGNKPVGDSRVIIEDGKDEPIVVHNGTEDFDSSKEHDDFQAMRQTSKHRKVFAGLKALCRNNERQYKAALTAMTQVGVDFYLMAVGRSGERPAHVFEFSRNAEGNLVVELRNGNEDTRCRLEATLEILPDGSAKYQKFHLENFKAAAMQRQEGWTMVDMQSLAV